MLSGIAVQMLNLAPDHPLLARASDAFLHAHPCLEACCWLHTAETILRMRWRKCKRRWIVQLSLSFQMRLIRRRSRRLPNSKQYSLASAVNALLAHCRVHAEYHLIGCSFPDQFLLLHRQKVANESRLQNKKAKSQRKGDRRKKIDYD